MVKVFKSWGEGVSGGFRGVSGGSNHERGFRGGGCLQGVLFFGGGVQPAQLKADFIAVKEASARSSRKVC
jgi:hypothetical protein